MAWPMYPRDMIHPEDTDNHNQAPALVTGAIVLIAAASIAVILRLISRRLKRLSWAADDYLVVVALIFAYGMFISFMFCIRNGLGRKGLVDGRSSSALLADKWLYVFEDLFPVTTAATKFSILYLYKRVFTTIDRKFAWALYAIAAVQLGWAISGFFTTVFQCWPVDTTWNPSRRHARCIELVPSLVSLACINTVCNAAILILPIPMIYQLQMSMKQKIGLSGIFVLACADVVASIIRTYMTSLAVNDPIELLWKAAPAVMLSFVEPCVGIVCACLPVMRPLLLAISGASRSVFSRSSSSATAPLNSKGSHSTNVSGSTTSGGYPVSEPIRAHISAKMPVGEGPLFTHRVQGGYSSQWPLLDDEEEAIPGIRVRNDIEQSTIRL